MSPLVAESFLQGLGLGFLIVGLLWAVQAGLAIVRRLMS